jgi:hypothetical protein
VSPKLRPENFTFNPGEQVPEHIPGDPSLEEQDPTKFYVSIRTAARVGTVVRELRESEKIVAANIDTHDVGVALMMACQRLLNAVRDPDNPEEPKRSAMLTYPTK